jgi:carboxyl-terminal processing protease
VSARAALLLAVVAAAAACSAIVGPDAQVTPLALFDRLWSDFDRHYSLFEVKGINWDSLRAEYRPQAAAASIDELTGRVIPQLLRNLADDHVLWRGSREGGSPRGIGMEPTAPGLYVAGIAGYTSGASGVSCGRVDSTIGYLRLASFDDTGWMPEVDSAIAALGPVESIIIDVRNNDGGLLVNALEVAGRFASRPTTAAYVRYRNGPGHSDFTSSISQQVTPGGPHQFHGKIVLLTSRNTVSAAELFVLAMRSLGHTTVVGDTTAGETGAPFLRELQNGWSYQFPESIEYTLDGSVFEGIGLAPDVPVMNDRRPDSRLSDLQLERAVSIAYVHGRSTERSTPSTLVRPQNAIVRSNSR